MKKIQHTRAEYSLSIQEVQNLINATANFRDRCILKCLYYGGMRVVEVTQLEVQHIDFSRKTIDIMDSKFGKTRTIPVIESQFLADLRHLVGKKDKGKVFVTCQKDSMDKRTVQYMVQRVGEKLGLKNPHPLMKHLNPHLFRHSIARHLKDQAYPLEFIQKFLGHASMKTTADMYGTLSLEGMKKLVARKTGDMALLGSETHVPDVVGYIGK